MDRASPGTRISVFGLGYVGSVSAACFADLGHDVVGVDLSRAKVDAIAAGHATVVEERIEELTDEVVRAGRLRATDDASAAVAATDVALVCVGTPSAGGGGLSTDALASVAREIGSALRGRGDRFTVVFRSTMLPGTCEDLLIPVLEEASGLRAGEGFGVCVNPEFLREGSSVRDFHDPPKTVIGELDPASGDVVARLYQALSAPVHRVPIRVAEMTKYADNSFHALKVGFANEIGAICKALGVDSHAVMEIFRADTKLNIAPTYLRPGYAFGGSCLPKDLRAILHVARHNDVEVPILSNVLTSNERQIARAVAMVEGAGHRQVGLFGLAFKDGTDDLRESPLLELAERLLGRGYELLIYDPHVMTARLQGANREYVAARIPHLERLLAPSPEAVVAHGRTLVVGSAPPPVLEALAAADGRVVVDLVGLPEGAPVHDIPHYEGISW